MSNLIKFRSKPSGEEKKKYTKKFNKQTSIKFVNIKINENEVSSKRGDIIVIL
jgi:hypothetical protein